MDLEHRVVLITGPRRIGAEVAKRAAARGADVALSYNQSRNEAEAAAAGIRATGRRAVCIQADLSNGPACQQLVDETVRQLGRLDVLVNMASLYAATPFDELNEALWDRGLAVDLKAAFLCARAAVPHMRAGGRRPHHQHRGLAAGERPGALQGLPAVLRRQERRHRPHRGAGARAGGRRDPRQRRGAGPDPRAARHGRRGGEGRRAGDAPRPLGRRGRNREGRPLPRRHRLRDGGGDTRRWRKTPAVTTRRSQKTEAEVRRPSKPYRRRSATPACGLPCF